MTEMDPNQLKEREIRKLTPTAWKTTNAGGLPAPAPAALWRYRSQIVCSCREIGCRALWTAHLMAWATCVLSRN